MRRAWRTWIDCRPRRAAPYVIRCCGSGCSRRAARTSIGGGATSGWRCCDAAAFGRLSGWYTTAAGPAHTNLLDEQFAPGLAAYAGAVARRYPWVDAYTPVNEPLTTARFSALYGHWYPHAPRRAVVLRALLNQCRAVVLAMRAIRRGESRGAARADRRYRQDLQHAGAGVPGGFRERAAVDHMGFAVRAGRSAASDVVVFHAGAAWRRRELAWFLDNACPPDVVG